MVLVSCSDNKKELAKYHNQLVNIHNDLKHTYEEMVDDFGWIADTDTLEKSRRTFAKEYKGKWRTLKRETIAVESIDEDQNFKESILTTIDFLVDNIDSLARAAGKIARREEYHFDFEKFDREVVSKFDTISVRRKKFVEQSALFD